MLSFKPTFSLSFTFIKRLFSFSLLSAIRVMSSAYLRLLIFNFYAEDIMQNARLDESQAGIKIARRNINYLRYVDDTTLKAESKEELKNPLMKVKEESEKAGLKLNIQKTKIMASCLIIS